MMISLVNPFRSFPSGGTQEVVHTDTGAVSGESSTTFTFPTLNENDCVLLMRACDFADRMPDQGGGYTKSADSGTNDPAMKLEYKVMGATPDTEVTVTNPLTFYRVVVAIMIIRGLDPVTPIGTVGTLAQGATAVAVPNSITISDPSKILFFAALDDDGQQGILPSGFPSGWDTQLSVNTVTSSGAVIGACLRDFAAGTVSEPSGITFQTPDDWGAYLVQLNSA